MHFQFQSVAAFFSMSGHGGYVWSCYLFTLLILAILICRPLLKKQQLMKDIERRQRLDANRQIQADEFK